MSVPGGPHVDIRRIKPLSRLGRDEWGLLGEIREIARRRYRPDRRVANVVAPTPSSGQRGACTPSSGHRRPTLEWPIWSSDGRDRHVGGTVECLSTGGVPVYACRHWASTAPRSSAHDLDVVEAGHSTVEGREDSTRPNAEGRAPSVAAPPEVDGVVDARGVGVLGEDEVGVLGVELDADDGLEVLARVEVPADVEALALPALPRPEALDGARVIAGQRPAEPRPEGRAGRVVVDDEGRAAGLASRGRARRAPARSRVRRSRPSGRARRRTMRRAPRSRRHPPRGPRRTAYRKCVVLQGWPAVGGARCRRPSGRLAAKKGRW